MVNEGTGQGRIGTKTMSQSEINQISDTAFWVSSYRAKESKRPDALFQDPYAEMLSGRKGQAIANNASDSKYAEWTVVIRTRVIDEMLKSLFDDGIEMVVNLGSGLDTRPYRMTLPKSLVWIEVDHPHMIGFKDGKLKSTEPRCQLQRLSVNLTDSIEREKLFADLKSRNQRSVVLTEGVIPYLTEEQVSQLAKDLHAWKEAQYWIVEFQAKEMYRHLNNKKKNKQMGRSPFQFFPEDWIGFFEKNGWKKKDLLYLGEQAKIWGRTFPLPWWAKVLHSFLPKEQLEKVQKMSGFMILEKIS